MALGLCGVWREPVEYGGYVYVDKEGSMVGVSVYVEWFVSDVQDPWGKVWCDICVVNTLATPGMGFRGFNVRVV